MNRPTNQELIDDYLNFYQHSVKSQDMRKSSLRYFFEKYGYKDHVFDITTKILKNYFIWLKNLDNLSVQTKKNKWGILTSFLNFTMEDYPEDFLIKIPSKTVNWLGTNGNGEKVKEDLTLEELEQILQYFKVRNLKYYLIFRLLAETGMRKGELINAKYPNVNIEKRYIKSKGKRDEVVYYFSKDLVKFLELYLDSRKELSVQDNILFLTNRFTKYSDRPFNLYLKKACKDLGIKKNVTCHVFRSTINIHRKRMGCNNEDRKILLNHKIRDVNTKNYTNLDYGDYIRLYDAYNPYKDLNL